MLRVSFSLVTLCAVGLCALLLLWAAPVLAEPSPHEIDGAAAAGRLDLAQVMVNQVLRDHPSSARAHYLQAEIFAKEGDAAAARVELSLADTLNPGLPDENPRNVEQLRRAIAAPAAREAPAPSELHFPFGLPLAGLALWWLMRRRACSSNFAPGASPGYCSPAGGASPLSLGSTVGSTVGHGLASGLAMGAGLATGAELAHRLMDGGLPACAPDAADFGEASSSAGWEDSPSAADSPVGED
jgi:hypothetical protein